MPGKKWQWKHNSKPMGYSKSSAKREVYSNSSLPERKKKRAISNKQPNLIPKATRKRKTNNNNNKTPKVSRKKEIIKIREEINERNGDCSKDQ